MTATNHTLTGALVGLTITVPIIALPLAFLLHFVLDSLPHYDNDAHTTRNFKIMLLMDALLAASVLLLITVVHPGYWWLGVLCGIACASPDLMWFPRWVNELRGRPNKPMHIVARFHSRIQRYATSQNYPYEVVWFIGCGLLLAKLI